MIDDTLEITARLVAWQINNLADLINSGTHKITSKDFMIGKWYWFMEGYIHTDRDKVLILIKARDAQNLPSPIVSLAVRVFCSKGPPIIDNNKVYTDAPGLFHLMEFTPNATTSVTIGLEFLDLKVKNDNDGKTYSIWNEEFPKENTSSESMNKMLSESIYTDIVINARDGGIGAHRAVLAANSPVFKVMFSGSYKEKETSTLNMDDMSIEACRAMLNFLYGERKSKELRANYISLIIAADKYDIVALKKACEASLCEDVGVENVFGRLVEAHTYDLPEVKRTCLFYLIKMGMIFELRKDYNSFIQEADRELLNVISNTCLDAWRAS